MLSPSIHFEEQTSLTEAPSEETSAAILSALGQSTDDIQEHEHAVTNHENPSFDENALLMQSEETSGSFLSSNYSHQHVPFPTTLESSVEFLKILLQTTIKEMNGLRTDVNRLTQQLDNKDEEKRQLTQQLSNKDKEKLQLSEALYMAAFTQAALQNENNDLKNEKANLYAHIKGLEEWICVSNAKQAEAASLMQDMDKVIKEKAAKIAELNNVIREKDNDIAKADKKNQKQASKLMFFKQQNKNNNPENNNSASNNNKRKNQEPIANTQSKRTVT